MCPLHLEDTAGAGGTLGRSFEELARLIEVAGGDKRLGVCLDSCHLLASGYDIRDAESLSAVLDEFDRVIGLDRLGSLHVNDSATPLGSNRDRHANLGDGEVGRKGIAAFLSEPRFEGMPCVLEGPGHKGKAIDKQDMKWAAKLRKEGQKARG
jgi:deoxyribonuclease-4